MPEISWFRTPTAEQPGTLNACYNALDIHVIKGHADDVALALDGVERTYAWLLTEVAACAGVLRAFGTGVGDLVTVGPLPPVSAVVAVLAVARVGAVSVHDASSATDARLSVALADDGDVAFAVDDEAVPWDVAMRAGRTDPAPSAEVAGDAVLARQGDDTLTVLAALGASDDQLPVPTGATLVEVGGLTLWSFDAPGAAPVAAPA